MTREINFRGWHIPTKRIINLKGITPLALDSKMTGDGLYLPFTDDVILMQFTGLLDKNGKEIYESDLLIDTLTKMKYMVKFGGCVKYAFNGWYVENEEHGYVATINGDYDSPMNSQIEVIGNIYEHTNLIKQQ